MVCKKYFVALHFSKKLKQYLPCPSKSKGGSLAEIEDASHLHDEIQSPVKNECESVYHPKSRLDHHLPCSVLSQVCAAILLNIMSTFYSFSSEINY